MDANHVQNESVKSNISYPFIDFHYKPIMIYYFVDPFCQQCWNVEPFIKKMTMEYGAYFNVRPIVGHMFNKAPNRVLELKHETVSNYNHLNKYNGSIGIKAAALQGNKAGRDFLHHVQQLVFLYNTNESIVDILLHAAKKANLDMIEFESDLLSLSAKNAYHSDIKLAHEMGVTKYPTLVFFSQYVEDYSIKVTELQQYEAYSFVLKKMLHLATFTVKKPPIETFIKKYKRVQTEEVSFIYDIPFKQAERNLKQLQLKQLVKKVVTHQNSFWEYCG